MINKKNRPDTNRRLLELFLSNTINLLLSFLLISFATIGLTI